MQDRYALALHGGAGVIPMTIAASVVEDYENALRRALSLGQNALERGATSLDVVVEVCRVLEDEPLFNAGKGSVFNREGDHELEASVMDGRYRRCGAVSGLTSVKNPIDLARRVMEKTEHVCLMGGGAEHFASEEGVEMVSSDYFFTKRRYAQWAKVFSAGNENTTDDVHGDEVKDTGTVGCVAWDKKGNLAAATSTGGRTNKLTGRQGDSSIIGAGTYADNRSCAVSCTGTGEQFMRHTIARDVAAMMEYGEIPLAEAVDRAIHRILRKGDGGLVAVSSEGAIAMDFNTDGMFRGAADSEGSFEVKIWR